MKILRISLSSLCLVILLIPLMRQDCHAQSIEQLKSGVVKITSKRPGGQEEEGSGFIVRLENNAAYIATAAHVIQGDSQPKVTFFRDQGKTYPARILGSEGGKPNGLAALIVEGSLPKGLTVLSFGASHSVGGGEDALIIGFPLYTGVPWAVTKGNITGFKGADLVFSGGVEEGNSGGPVLVHGKVVGLMMEKKGKVGLAVPALIVQFVLKNFIGATPGPSELSAGERDLTTAPKGVPMKLISAGKFWMGSQKNGRGDAPRHQVFLDDYYLEQLETTVGEYKTFLEETGRKAPTYWNQVDFARDGDKPVIGLAWEDAQTFCQWAGKRLPTEAEWEKAARGIDGFHYPWGNSPPSSQLANFNQPFSTNPYQEGLINVGSYEKGKSPYGILDMAGNVWEWVSDYYDKDYYQISPAQNPRGPSNGSEKILRGGSWLLGDLAPASRTKTNPDRGQDTFGVRCAKDAE